MTRLLVSVRSVAEAAVAAEAGADLIDVKEPLRGSLGRADQQTISDVVSLLAGRLPVSAAFGELIDPALADKQPVAPEDLGSFPDFRLDYAKVGLAGCAKLANWSTLWREWTTRFAASVKPVAVVYADWQRAEAPTPEAVLEMAIGFDCRTILIDTFNKRSGALADLWPIRSLGLFIKKLKTGGICTVLAGSLDYETLPVVLKLRPDIVAVRGAACRGDRTSTIDARKVQRLAAAVHRRSAPMTRARR